MRKNMNTQHNQPKPIDFLQLSDAEKARLLDAARQALRQSVEEAKFWRTAAECEK
jgi:hypothetical protein